MWGLGFVVNWGDSDNQGVPRWDYPTGLQSHHHTLLCRVSMVESSAFRDLRTRIFANQGALLDKFQAFDPDSTGLITTSEWAESLRDVLSLDLPWRTLRSKLVEMDDNG